MTGVMGMHLTSRWAGQDLQTRMLLLASSGNRELLELQGSVCVGGRSPLGAARVLLKLTRFEGHMTAHTATLFPACSVGLSQALRPTAPQLTSGFLSLGAGGILGWVILCCVGRPMRGRLSAFLASAH